MRLLHQNLDFTHRNFPPSAQFLLNRVKKSPYFLIHPSSTALVV